MQQVRVTVSFSNPKEIHIFLLVLFTVFEVYLYLLKRLFVDRELLTNLVYLHIMNIIYYHCGARQLKKKWVDGFVIARRSAASTRSSVLRTRQLYSI